MQHKNQDSSTGIYFILAIIFGVLTGWVSTSSIVYALVGAIVGMLFAGLFVNVFVKGKHD
ncbi:hypothetical protein B0I27_103343 [Arcticibacter pallidicorallinus]|uniref:Uncharacterized protein n=1 Tax=Arcticibacter pallidicorallinus TaxID=1259464 RepID=A0A2T0U7H2_9SPHI|nr:hypothetical protein [Arcticibacter pallidicorallinus]PRY53870.1 hypothetical protein B0I27_103343 [Arcticibacter pallidicorallinus]